MSKTATYATYPLIVIDPSGKYGMTMSVYFFVPVENFSLPVNDFKFLTKLGTYGAVRVL